MISLPGDKDSQAQALTENLKKQAEQICKGLDEVFGEPQPVVKAVPEVPVSIVVPKGFKAKLAMAEKTFESAKQAASRTNLLTRIYAHYTQRTPNANAGTK